jgi:hypothetical protein
MNDEGKPAVERWLRIPEDPKLLVGSYASLAEKLEVVITRLGAFDRALSVAPALLLSFGITIFAIGIILRTYEPGFSSGEFNDMTLFAAVFVVASTAIYIAEIRVKDAAERDRTVLESAHKVLEAIAKQSATGSPVVASAPTGNSPALPAANPVANGSLRRRLSRRCWSSATGG